MQQTKWKYARYVYKTEKSGVFGGNVQSKIYFKKLKRKNAFGATNK